MNHDLLRSLYPVLAGLPAGLRDAVLAEQAQAISVAPGTRLFDEGSPCGGFPLVLRGSVRVARGAPTSDSRRGAGGGRAAGRVRSPASLPTALFVT